MTNGFSLESLLDALADRVAERVSQRLGPASLGTRLLTIEQAALYIGRSVEAVRHMVTAGKVPTVRADRRTQIDIRDLDRWIEINKQNDTNFSQNNR